MMVDDIASGLQEFLICIEMFFASNCSCFRISAQRLHGPNGQQPRGILRNLRIMFDVRDVVDDVQGAVDHGVQRTTDNIMGRCQHGWNTTKQQTQKALQRPKKLLDMWSGRQRGTHDEYGDDDGDGAAHRRLMTYTCVLIPLDFLTGNPPTPLWGTGGQSRDSAHAWPCLLLAWHVCGKSGL
eukprot:jgi/Botrbrau1/18425/Bobra.0072s0017.1